MATWKVPIEFLPYVFRPCPRRPLSTLSYRPLLYCSLTCRGRFLHVTSSNLLPRRRDFFSSNVPLSQQHHPTKDTAEPIQEASPAQKRRSTRTPSAKTSLRRVAVEAQRSRDGSQAKKAAGIDGDSHTQVRGRPLNPTSDLLTSNSDGNSILHCRKIRYIQDRQDTQSRGI
jgi:hypothetical protein